MSVFGYTITEINFVCVTLWENSTIYKSVSDDLDITRRSASVWPDASSLYSLFVKPDPCEMYHSHYGHLDNNLKLLALTEIPCETSRITLFLSCKRWHFQPTDVLSRPNCLPFLVLINSCLQQANIVLKITITHL